LFSSVSVLLPNVVGELSFSLLREVDFIQTACWVIASSAVLSWL
jgi:hypothetical protein